MKKYQTPETEVIEIKVETALLAISTGGGVPDPNDPLDP